MCAVPLHPEFLLWAPLPLFWLCYKDSELTILSCFRCKALCLMKATQIVLISKVLLDILLAVLNPSHSWWCPRPLPSSGAARKLKEVELCAEALINGMISSLQSLLEKWATLNGGSADSDSSLPRLWVAILESDLGNTTSSSERHFPQALFPVCSEFQGDAVA